MTGTIYNHNYLTGLVLNNPGKQDPATINTGITIANTGTTHNGDAIFGASGTAWTITNHGTVEATAANALGIALYQGGLVTNGSSAAHNALIASRYIAVGIQNGSGTVVNFGTIDSTGTSASAAGIDLVDGGMVINESRGLIEAAGAAVDASQFTTIVNGGAIETTNQSGNPATAAVNLGSGGEVVNSGRILALAKGVGGAGGIGIAVQSQNGGTVTNAATGAIDAYQNAIDFVAAFGTVGNLGVVWSTGADATAIDFQLGGVVTNGSTAATSALIKSTHVAVAGSNQFTTIVNFGTIASTGGGTGGAGVSLTMGGIVTNAAGGLIVAHDTAIFVGPAVALTLINEGTVKTTGATDPAVYSGDGVLITNGPDALVSAPSTAIAVKGAFGFVSNFGTIAAGAAGAGGAAIDFYDGGEVTNGSSTATAALIESAKTAIDDQDQYGTIVNFGTIKSTSTGAAGIGVYLNHGGIISNAAGALITAYRDALLDAPGIGATLTNDGTISATGSAGAAVLFEDGGVVTNGADTSHALIKAKAAGIAIEGGFGMVSNLGTVALIAGGTAGAAAIYIADGGVVSNGSTAATGALIDSAATGVLLANQFATLVNFGTIRGGSAGAAVYMNGGGVIVNARSGVIIGTSDVLEVPRIGTTSTAATLSNAGLIENTGTLPGLYFDTFFQVTNSGTITSTSSRTAIDAMTVGTVVNTGAITAPAAIAIAIGNGSTSTKATIAIINEGAISGTVGVGISTLDTGFNTLVNDGTITGTDGTAFAFGGGDDTLILDPGSQLNGALANLHPGDRIDFVDQVGTAVTYSGGVLTLKNGTTTVGSPLHLLGSFEQSQFAVNSDNHGGTNITLNSA